MSVRPEDAFDVAAVDAWLRAHDAGALESVPAGLPTVRQFRGGASNLTYRLGYPTASGDEVALVLRRPPAGQKAASAHDMGREFGIQRALAGHFPVPEVIAHCTDPAVIDSDFYVMREVPGLILRADPPSALDGLGERIVDALADLHAVDVEAVGLGHLYKGPGYVGRQVAGWSERYRRARTEDVPDGEAVMAWLAEHQPADVGACLIHGDWRMDNLVLDPDSLEIRAVLDWEMATVGDPLMDLGSALAYWVQADDDAVFQAFRRQPSHLPGMPTREEFLARYLDRAGIAGLPGSGWAFYEVFGLFRLAVIVQQIWFRFTAGQTSNPAFASFGAACTYLIARCERIIS